MKSVIIWRDGRRVNLAGDITPEIYVELEHTKSPRSDPVLFCGGCGGGIEIIHGWKLTEALYGRHHPGAECTADLTIRRPGLMSDEHRRQAEYHALAAQQAGYNADLEVTTTGHTRVDVVVDDRIGIEVQRSALSKTAAGDRTARSVASGLETVAWFSDWGTDPAWYGHVPGYKTTMRAAVWKQLPALRTITAVGPRTIEAVRCGTRRLCQHRGRCPGWIPWDEPWRGLLVDDVTIGLTENTIRPVILHGKVTLLGNRSIATYSGVTGTQLIPHDPGQPQARPLRPSAEQQCDRLPVQSVPVQDERRYVIELCERYGWNTEEILSQIDQAARTRHRHLDGLEHQEDTSQ